MGCNTTSLCFNVVCQSVWSSLVIACHSQSNTMVQKKKKKTIQGFCPDCGGGGEESHQLGTDTSTTASPPCQFSPSPPSRSECYVSLYTQLLSSPMTDLHDLSVSLLCVNTLPTLWTFYFLLSYGCLHYIHISLSDNFILVIIYW